MPPTAPKIFRIAIPVADIDAAAKFYTTLLGVEGRRIAPSRHYFMCGDIILACVDPRGEGHAAPFRPNPDHIYFCTPDLDTALANARRAGADIYTIDHAPIDDTPARAKPPAPSTVSSPIQTQPWGERSFYCRDPFANQLCFVDEKTLFTGRRPTP